MDLYDIVKEDNTNIFFNTDAFFCEEVTYKSIQVDGTFIESTINVSISEKGRTLDDDYGEAQNLTAHEVKTILTRVGENTKIVLTGDIEQIDNVYTNETSNGLTYAIEKFKESTLSGHITFKKGERSKLATEASKLL